MRNLYLVQVVDSLGPNKFLPLAVSYQWLHAQQDARVATKWQCAGVLLEKLPISDWVKQLQDPGMVAVSCYVWNWQYNCALAAAIKQQWPACWICVGGPHVPKHEPGWMQAHPYFDVAVLGENETAFRDILADPTPAAWCELEAVMTANTRLAAQPLRTQKLDSIPSPILTGFYDRIMQQYPADTQWQVTWESMRGCPYHCAYCDIGDSYWNKTYWFDMNRIRQEIEWMGEHKIEYVSVCDSNWGISERDCLITQWVIDTKLRTGYPRVWDVTWAKNNRERVAEIALMDQRAGTRLFKGITFAVQSMDPGTLENVERFNLSDHNLETSMSFYHNHDVPTYSELIWPLPGESLESFSRGLQRIINIGQRDFLMVHPLVLTPNAPMGQQLYRRMHGIESRTVPLDTFWLRMSDDDGYLFETVEAVSATQHVDFDGMLQGHMLAYWLIVLYYYGWAHSAIDYVHETTGRSHISVVTDIMTWAESHPDSLFGREHWLTRHSIQAVFEQGKPWGRCEVIDREYWEYKSATSVIFHQNRDLVRQCLVECLKAVLGQYTDYVLDINLARCHDWRRSYPFTLETNADISATMTGIASGSLQFDHWDRSITQDDDFVRVAYHYQRKNRYWQCTVIDAA